MKTQILITAAVAALTFNAHAIDLPEVDPMVLGGDIICAGSSTVYPLSERMAERFKDEGFEGNISVDSIGSGAGFERFCSSCETDISNASRPIKGKEVTNCDVKCKRTPIEIRVGTDALAVVVSKRNKFVKELSIVQLRKIWSKEGKLWSDIDPSWPKKKIQHFSPGTDSGTFDYFAEAMFKKIAKKTGGDHKKMLLDSPGLQLSEDDNVLVQGVTGSPYAIGYFGFAYYVANARKLRALEIDGIKASAENVDNATYPLARPLFMYTSAEIIKKKPQVAGFLNFYLTFVNEEVEDVGYFPASQADLDEAKEAWLNAVK